MKSFILEVGKDFTFIDEEYKVMVGNSDFFIDLLFYHRGLQCLVAFELKVGKFKPEYISKMDFYLEALDRQIKKENENPSVGIVILSVIMTIFNNDIANIILRDILMILVLGFFFPLYFTIIENKKSVSVLGIHKKKIVISLAINIIAAIMLLVMFISGNTETIMFSKNSFFAITYILVAGVFEMVCIYGFFRYEVERAFGIIPAIIMTAVFYSLHHAGFQPEFLKLFFVGIMYVSVFYITKNIFSIFPFFWGVGAIWDVLINSEAGKQIENIQSFYIAILMLISMLGICIYIYKRK